MKVNYRLIFLGMVMVTNLSVAQTKIQVEGGIGYGSFSMSQLKDLLNFQNRGNGIPPSRVLEEYPAYYTFTGQIDAEFFEKIRFGIIVGYTSTGGRIHYSDFSGEISLEHLVSSLQVGVTAERLFIKNERFELGFYTRVSMLMTSLDFDNKLDLGVLSDRILVETRSKSIAISPGFRFRKAIFKGFYIGAGIGALIDIGATAHLKGNTDALLLDGQGKELKANWSGLRLNLTLGFKL